MYKNRSTIQLIWGILLVMAGIGVFFRVPQVMPRIAEIKQFSSVTIYIRFCFYFIGMVLVGGGARKIYEYVK